MALDKHDYAKDSLKMHYEAKGKIEVVSAVPVRNSEDLSLAYTPGVAAPCLEIQKDIRKSYELTRRWNLCLVVTDGTAGYGGQMCTVQIFWRCGCISTLYPQQRCG